MTAFSFELDLAFTIGVDAVLARIKGSAVITES